MLLETAFPLPDGLPANRYEIHRYVMALVNGTGSDDGRRFLFAVEGDGDFPEPGAPAFAMVRAAALPPGLASKARRLEPPARGADLLFRLRTCPGRRNGSNGNSGRARPILGEEALLGWLARIAVGAGFTFDPADVAVAVPARFPRFLRRGVSFAKNETVFSGRLSVVDEAMFARALAQGVGRDKGLGYGLIQIH